MNRTRPMLNIRRNSILMHCGLLLINIFTPSLSCFAQQTSSIHCAVRVETTDDNSLGQSGTACYVKFSPNGRDTNHYLFTAYHVVAEKTTVKVSVRAEKEFLLNGPVEYFKDDFYFDAYSDVAVFQLSEAGVKAFEILEANGTLKAIRLYADGKEGPPIGATAKAVGNPANVPAGPQTYRPRNVVYHSTVSEFELPSLRLHQIFDLELRNDYRLYEADRIKNGTGKFVLLETLSIKQGFSGGPVIDAASDQLIGIILGGTPQVDAGRVAWACPANTLREAILQYHEKSVASDVKTHGNRSLKKLTGNSRDWPASPFQKKSGTAYNVEDTYVLDNLNARREIPRELLENVIQKTREGARIIFRNWGFPANAFQFQRLTGVQFEDCEFDALSLDSTILLGVVFVNCNISFDSATNGSNSIDGEQQQGQPLLACGIRIVTAELQGDFAPRPRRSATDLFSLSSISELENSRQALSRDIAPSHIAPLDGAEISRNISQTLENLTPPQTHENRKQAEGPVILSNPFKRKRTP